MTAPSIREALEALVNAKALKGVRELVAGWNGEGRDEPYKERHPSRLGATLPKTNCGAVYELDEAMQNARAALAAPPQDVVEGIARIIDPHSFMDIPFTDDAALLDMVEQSKALALRKATAILAFGLVTTADVPLQNAWAAKAKLLADHAIPYREGTWYFDNDLTRDMFIDAAVSCFNAPNMRQAHDEAAIRADERERCARVAERTPLNSYDAGQCRADIVAAIRAGGSEKC